MYSIPLDYFTNIRYSVSNNFARLLKMGSYHFSYKGGGASLHNDI